MKASTLGSLGRAIWQTFIILLALGLMVGAVALHSGCGGGEPGPESDGGREPGTENTDPYPPKSIPVTCYVDVEKDVLVICTPVRWPCWEIPRSEMERTGGACPNEIIWVTVP